MQKLPNANGPFAPILLWEYLWMKSDDDPEARIRELEQPLADTARASEAGVTPPPGKWAAPPVPAFPPTPPGPAFPPPPLPYSGSSSGASSRNRIWWIVAAVFVIGMIALPAGILFFTARQVSHSGLTTLLPNPSAAPSTLPSAVTTAAPIAPAGANLTISGIKESRTIACNQSAINVSGISNKVVITGHCASLDVSGVQNSITVDTVDSIEVSGFNNQITYHTGSPTIENAGDQNVVHQG
jgi:Protein of unknown function (DUF3060)